MDTQIYLDLVALVNTVATSSDRGLVIAALKRLKAFMQQMQQEQPKLVESLFVSLHLRLLRESDNLLIWEVLACLANEFVPTDTLDTVGEKVIALMIQVLEKHNIPVPEGKVMAGKSVVDALAMGIGPDPLVVGAMGVLLDIAQLPDVYGSEVAQSAITAIGGEAD